MALLEVENLTILLPTTRGPVAAVREISFSLERNATLGMIGESGSGKTLTALALIGLLPEAARVRGSIRFAARELVGASERTLCAIRGNRIGMIFQEPMSALNPLQNIGAQVAEPLILHRGLSRGQAWQAALALLGRVGLPDPARRAWNLPHQLSGGQRQRALIAIALACAPDLLIADEPTTALDATTQKHVIDLIADLTEESGMALLLISHDLALMAQNVARTLVLYGGAIVEEGPTDAVFSRLAHPYTRLLFQARPKLDTPRGGRLKTIPGNVPALADRPPGCPFAGRCPLTLPACDAGLPPAAPVGAMHSARCIRLDVALELV